MNTFQFYCYATSGWLAIQGLPLLVAPRLALTIGGSSYHQVLDPAVSHPAAHKTSPADAEVHLAHILGLTLLAFALLALIQTGAVRIISSITDGDVSASDQAGGGGGGGDASHRTATVAITTLYHAAKGVLSYVHYMSVSKHAATYTFGGAVNGGLAALGVLVLIFGGGETVKTSKWPFEPAEKRTARKERKGKKT